MRNILLPFEYIETIPHLIDCAVALAKKYNSSVSGVAIHQRIDSFIAQEGSIVFDSLHHGENKEEAIKYKTGENINIQFDVNNSYLFSSDTGVSALTA